MSQHPHAVIPILASDAAPGGCAACHTADDGPHCLSLAGQPCLAPQLSGPADELQRLLQALAQRLDFPPQAPELGGVRALRVTPGEVELQLAVPPGCGTGAAITDAAFQTLRALLPDTDIYITHAG